MKKFFYAVLHILAGTDFKKVSALCTKVTNALIANVIIYPAADPSTADLGTEGGLLILYISKADSPATRSKRDKQSIKVYKMLQQETRYVNNVAIGDKETIQLSGFDASLEPEPLQVPESVVIKSVTKGIEPLSAKIKIKAQKVAKNYIVQITTTPEDEKSWVTVLSLSSSLKLILKNLIRGQEIFIRIAAANSHGQGDWSIVATYIAQ